MDNYILTEFSIFYKRLMYIEITLKKLLYKKYNDAHGEGALNIVYRYIREIEKHRNENNKTFSKIFNSNKTNQEKLELFFDKMYLSEILNLFANRIFLKNKKIVNNFFSIPVKTNETTFQKKQKYLKEFRNCIAHFNQKKYSIDKTKYIDALIYFEGILNCNLNFNYYKLSQINKNRKLSLKEILYFIYQTDNSLFSDDRLLISLFDDIALINGYSFMDLPQRKSIIREHFRIKEKERNNEKIQELTLENSFEQGKLDLK